MFKKNIMFKYFFYFKELKKSNFLYESQKTK